MFFQRSGEYQASLFRLASPERLAAFLRSVVLSRYVGIVRCHQGEIPMLDILWDTTDRLRGESYQEQILGVVAIEPRAVELVDRVAAEFNVPAG